MKKYSAFVFLFVLISAADLSAERRVFQYRGQIKSSVGELIDSLSASGIQFSVKGVFNQSNDGKEGFAIYMKPSNRYCEITYKQNNGTSSVTVFAQDTGDLNRISQALISRMKMTEIGVTDIPEDKKPWPVQGLR